MVEEEINPINKLKILSCYKEIKEALLGNMPVPRTVEFFISNACNHNCAGCHSAMLHKSKTPFLKIEKAKELLDELSHMGVEGIEISGGGEPLMYPDIIEFIEYAYKCGFKAGIFTNGTLIKDEILPTLNKLLFLRIALDTGTRKTYKKIRGVDDFDKLMENVRKILDYRKENKGKVIIGLKYLIYDQNYKEIVQGAKIAKDLGVDYIQFKPLRKSSHCIKDIKKVEKLINDAKKLSTNKFRVLGGLQKSKITERCILNVLHPVIDASGDVYLCTFWKHRQESHKIGNVYEQNFKELWYSERHRNAYASTNPKDCNHWDCPFHYPNHIAREAIVKKKMHLEFI